MTLHKILYQDLQQEVSQLKRCVRIAFYLGFGGGLVAGFFLGGKAYGATAALPIKSTIVQCGEMEKMEQACADDARCCVFLEPAAGEYSAPIDDGRGGTTSCELWQMDDGNYPVCVRNQE